MADKKSTDQGSDSQSAEETTSSSMLYLLESVNNSSSLSESEVSRELYIYTVKSQSSTQYSKIIANLAKPPCHYTHIIGGIFHNIVCIFCPKPLFTVNNTNTYDSGGSLSATVVLLYFRIHRTKWSMCVRKVRLLGK